MRDKDVVSSLSDEALATAKIFANDFTRSGVRLPPHARSQFVSLSSDILSLGRTFLSNLASPGKPIHLSFKDIKGADLLGSRFTNRDIEVQPNSPMAYSILRSANEEATRKKVYIASKTSTAEQLDVLERLLRTRAKLANLVGYSSFADMTLGDKMVKTSGELVVHAGA